MLAGFYERKCSVEFAVLRLLGQQRVSSRCCLPVFWPANDAGFQGIGEILFVSAACYEGLKFGRRAWIKLKLAAVMSWVVYFAEILEHFRFQILF
jgi:hypothetical protein